MAYSLSLAERLKKILKDYPVLEKKMFGRVGFLLNGNMLCGVIGNSMIARVEEGRYLECLAKPGTKPFDMTGHPMKGWVQVLPEGIEKDSAMGEWVGWCLEFVSTLPGK